MTEIIYPEWLQTKLLDLGLELVELKKEEWIVASRIKESDHRLSMQDATAMAIAKCRNIPLVTGDGLLRRTALKQGISVRGTLWVLDALFEAKVLGTAEYVTMIHGFLAEGNDRRLPKKDLLARLSGCSKS